MFTPIRVIIADDSAVARRLLTEVFQSERDFEIVVAARNGEEALRVFQKKSADVVVLDVDMPVMDGITAVKEIRKIDQQVPIIMFSSLTEKGGVTTLSSLEAGATDFVTKPSVVGHLTEAMDYIRNELVFRVRLHSQQKTNQSKPFTGVSVKQDRELNTSTTKRSASSAKIEVVVIGSSTGGPNALTEVLKRLPSDLSVPVLVVQHMPPVFTKLLAERLNKVCDLVVEEAVDGVKCESGKVLIAPGDYHMHIEIKSGRPYVRLDQSETENSCRPAVDVLFRSAAEQYGKHTLGVILTGMGQDGLKGCEKIHATGGRILTQDAETSVVWGMPRAVSEAGLADEILPLDKVGNQITNLVNHRSRSLAAS